MDEEKNARFLERLKKAFVLFLGHL